MAWIRVNALTLVKLLLVPLGFVLALVTVMGVSGPVLAGMLSSITDANQAASVAYSLSIVPVGLLAWWFGRRWGGSGTIPTTGAAAPAMLTVGLLAVASLPGVGEALGETLHSSALAILGWGVGIVALGALLRTLLARGRVVVAWLAGVAGGFFLLTLSTAAYVFSAVEAFRAPRQSALYWYLSAVSGIDPGLVDRAYLQLADEIKVLPTMLTICTVFALALMSRTTSGSR